jgi:hypothetical protein
MRVRVFGLPCNLNKFPLIRYRRRVDFSAGRHSIRNVTLSTLRASLLHFKYFSDLPERARVEALRREHYDSAAEYRCYDEVLSRKRELSPYHAGSHRFEGSHTLLDLDVMRSSPGFDAFVRAQAAALDR